MPQTVDLVGNSPIVYTQYNLLRDDVSDVIVGHGHTGVTDDGVQIIKTGAYADIPAAASTNTGWLFFATDTRILYRSSGSAWVNLSTIYTEITTPPSQAGTASWTDFDLSATIPASAKAVVIHFKQDNANGNGGARKNGSSMTYQLGIRAQYSTVTFIVELDANRIIEIITATGSDLFYAIGYFS